MKTVEFKTVSPLFEMERDGIKPFTTRYLAFEDERRDEVFRFKNFPTAYPLTIKITNPTTGESFERKVKHITDVSWNHFMWINIHW